MVVTTLDTCTSLLAGTIIFGILGNLASKMNVDVPNVVKSGGTGLAFISYPEAIARFEAVPWVRSFLRSFKLYYNTILVICNSILCNALRFGSGQPGSLTGLRFHSNNGRFSPSENLARFLGHCTWRIYYRTGLRYSSKFCIFYILKFNSTRLNSFQLGFNI